MTEMQVFKLIERLLSLPANQDLDTLQLLRLHRQWDAEDRQHPDLDMVLRQHRERIQKYLDSCDLTGLHKYVEVLAGEYPILSILGEADLVREPKIK